VDSCPKNGSRAADGSKITAGEFDLVLGIGCLRELAKKTGFPFVSVNLVDAGGAAIFPRYVIRSVGGKNIGQPPKTCFAKN